MYGMWLIASGLMSSGSFLVMLMTRKGYKQKIMQVKQMIALEQMGLWNT
jgi:DNA polymerase III alpha subunit (gram-positive type)